MLQCRHYRTKTRIDNSKELKTWNIVVSLGLHTHNRLTAFVRDDRVGRYQKKHSPTHTQPDHRTSCIIFLHLQWSMASSVHFTCLTILSDNLSPGPLWSSSWSWTLNFILHTFLPQSSSSFRSTCPYQCSLFCYKTNAMSSITSHSLSSLLGNLSFSLTPHIHLTILISARWSATTFLSLQARSHFHATCCFTHNYYTTFLSKSKTRPYW